MYLKQHTIQKPVSVSGVGLHTGKNATMTFVPAPINHGIKFQRIDLEGQPTIEADADLVVDTSRGTTLEQNGARIYTVEHALAALTALEIDNVLIQIDGPEPPILDGSSVLFLKPLEEAGLEEQNAPRNFFAIPEEIIFKNEEKGIEISALPAQDYRFNVTIDYGSAVLGTQQAKLNSLQAFKTDIASCRTFCFLHEIEHLYKNGLIKGGDLSNAIVIVDKKVSKQEVAHLAQLLGKPEIEVKEEGFLNNVEALRFPNEPARHKLLDLIGDLALVGRPLKGQITALRPGHASNVELAKKIKEYIRKNSDKKIIMNTYSPDMPTVMDAVKISQTLPHRFPFVMIDKVFHLDENSVAAMKAVTTNEWFFQGHFPENPVMPGVLQVEGLAQAGGIFALSTVPDPENYWTYFLRIDNCRFFQKVVPGDIIVYHCKLVVPIKRGIVKMEGMAYVNGKVVCESEMTASITRKDNAK